MSDPTMRRVVLHGHFKTLYPHEIYMSAETVAELINGLCKQIKVFNPSVGKPRYVMRVLGFDTPESLFEPTVKKEIHIVPAFFGGKGGLWQIAIGAVLIATAIINPFGLIAAAGSGAFITTSTLFFLGATLVLGGILQLLSPAPNADLAGSPDQDPEASKYLGSPGNTVRIGTRIPLLYGEHKAYGHYLSFDIDAKRV